LERFVDEIFDIPNIFRAGRYSLGWRRGWRPCALNSPPLPYINVIFQATKLVNEAWLGSVGTMRTPSMKSPDQALSNKDFSQESHIQPWYW
jgi:hypothetical protein